MVGLMSLVQFSACDDGDGGDCGGHGEEDARSQLEAAVVRPQHEEYGGEDGGGGGAEVEPPQQLEVRGGGGGGVGGGGGDEVVKA